MLFLSPVLSEPYPDVLLPGLSPLPVPPAQGAFSGLFPFLLNLSCSLRQPFSGCMCQLFPAAGQSLSGPGFRSVPSTEILSELFLSLPFHRHFSVLCTPSSAPGAQHGNGESKSGRSQDPTLPSDWLLLLRCSSAPHAFSLLLLPTEPFSPPLRFHTPGKHPDCPAGPDMRRVMLLPPSVSEPLTQPQSEVQIFLPQFPADDSAAVSESVHPLSVLFLSEKANVSIPAGSFLPARASVSPESLCLPVHFLPVSAAVFPFPLSDYFLFLSAAQLQNGRRKPSLPDGL